MQYGTNALVAAATEGHTDCVRLLLNAGVDKEKSGCVRCVSCRESVCNALCFFSVWMLIFFMLLHLKLTLVYRTCFSKCVHLKLCFTALYRTRIEIEFGLRLSLSRLPIVYWVFVF